MNGNLRVNGNIFSDNITELNNKIAECDNKYALKSENDELKTKIENLESENAALKAAIANCKIVTEHRLITDDDYTQEEFDTYTFIHFQKEIANSGFLNLAVYFEDLPDGRIGLRNENGTWTVVTYDGSSHYTIEVIYYTDNLNHPFPYYLKLNHIKGIICVVEDTTLQVIENKIVFPDL